MRNRDDLRAMTRDQYYAYIESLGHRLKGSETGGVDPFVMDYDTHNGPGCVVCRESWCEHCRDDVDPCEGPI